MSPKTPVRRRFRYTPLSALCGLATLVLLGGSLALPTPDSGRTAAVAAPVQILASQPPQPTPTVPTSPSPTPAPASEPPVVQQAAAVELASVQPPKTATPKPKITPPARPKPKPKPTATPTPRPKVTIAPRQAAPAVPGGARAYAQAQVGPAQFACLSPLWERESGWNANAVNRSSGAYGIPQALPGAHGRPYTLGDYRAQIDWGLNYIRNRYGSPCGAWSFWQSHNWY